MFATLAPPTELIELLTIFPALMMIFLVFFALVERPGAIPFSAFKKWRHFINQSHFSGTGNPNGAAAASLGLSLLSPHRIAPFFPLGKYLCLSRQMALSAEQITAPFFSPPSLSTYLNSGSLLSAHFIRRLRTSSKFKTTPFSFGDWSRPEELS